jgi:hypothetical protein
LTKWPATYPNHGKWPTNLPGERFSTPRVSTESLRRPASRPGSAAPATPATPDWPRWAYLRAGAAAVYRKSCQGTAGGVTERGRVFEGHIRCAREREHGEGGRPGAIIMLRRSKTEDSEGEGEDGEPLEILRVRVRVQGRPEPPVSALCCRMSYHQAIHATRVRSAVSSPPPRFPLRAG